MTTTSAPGSDIVIRNPVTEDGTAMWQLLVDAGTLDVNSSYLYLLLCRDFAPYCAVAERGDEMVGFVTGFTPPLRPDVWFLWQIGVSATARGEGIANRLAFHVLKDHAARGGQYLETTVTASNKPSRALFNGIARHLDTRIEEQELFTAEMFPEGGHEAEPLIRIGPFDAAAVARATEQ
jgi:L-2,4-diaminobutyric acid acetyltransferase